MSMIKSMLNISVKWYVQTILEKYEELEWADKFFNLSVEVTNMIEDCLNRNNEILTLHEDHLRHCISSVDRAPILFAAYVDVLVRKHFNPEEEEHPLGLN